MSALGLSTQAEYDQLGSKLKAYEGAESFVLDQLAPITNGVADFLYPTVFLAFAIIGLMWWSMRLSPARGVRYLLSVAFVSVLMFPVQIGNAQVPASFYWFNFLTNQALGALQAVVDGTLRGPGGPGNYAAALHPLSAYSSGAGGGDLRGTELARVVEAYGTTCKQAAVAAGLTQAEMEAVGLSAGALGVDIPGAEKLRAQALAKLKGAGGDALLYQREYYFVAARSWWLAREGQKNLAPAWIVNTDPELQYDQTVEGGARGDADTQRFFPRDCAGFHKLADRSVREYQFATEARTKTAALHAGITPSEEKSGLVLLGAQIAAAHQVHAAAGKEEKKPAGIGASIASYFMNALETLVATTAMKLVNWFSELITKWFVFAVPAIAALGIGLMFVIWPVVVLMALIPGRERSIGEFLYYVIFIKLFLFFSYIILKVGGALFLSAVDGFARDGTASLASMTFISGLVIMIGVMWGAPKLASAVTFSQSGGGLAGAMGMGAIGGMQIANAARMITGRGVNLIPGARPAGTPGGNLKPPAGRGAMPQAPVHGASPGGTGGSTLKGVRDKLSGGKK